MVKYAVVIYKGNAKDASVRYRGRCELLQNSLHNVASRGLAGVMAGGDYDASIAVADVQAGDAPSLSASAKLGDLECAAFGERDKAVGVIEHIVSEVDGAFSASEAVGEALAVDAVEPMPIFQIVADGGTPIAQALAFKFEGDLAILGTLDAKRPIKPISLGVAELVLEDHGIARYFLDADIAACEILMYFHFYLLRSRLFCRIVAFYIIPY